MDNYAIVLIFLGFTPVGILCIGLWILVNKLLTGVILLEKILSRQDMHKVITNNSQGYQQGDSD